MKKIRYVLSMPFYALQLVIACVIMGMLWGSKMLYRGHDGARIHLFWPVLQVKRIVQGEPRWQVHDLLFLNIQPTTAEAKALALADSRLMKIECECGNPTCFAKDGLFVANAGGVIPMPVNLTDAQRSMSEMPNVVVEVKRREELVKTGLGKSLGNGRFTEASSVVAMTKLEAFEENLKKQIRHVVGCDHPGCSNAIATYCMHSSRRADGKIVALPECAYDYLKVHGWRTVGDDNFCPDHEVPSDDASPPVR